MIQHYRIVRVDRNNDIGGFRVTTAYKNPQNVAYCEVINLTYTELLELMYICGGKDIDDLRGKEFDTGRLTTAEDVVHEHLVYARHRMRGLAYHEASIGCGSEIRHPVVKLMLTEIATALAQRQTAPDLSLYAPRVVEAVLRHVTGRTANDDLITGFVRQVEALSNDTIRVSLKAHWNIPKSFQPDLTFVMTRGSWWSGRCNWGVCIRPDRKNPVIVREF